MLDRNAHVHGDEYYQEIRHDPREVSMAALEARIDEQTEYLLSDSDFFKEQLADFMVDNTYFTQTMQAIFISAFRASNPISKSLSKNLHPFLSHVADRAETDVREDLGI